MFILVVIAIPTAAFLYLQNKSVQNKLADKISRELSEKLETVMDIKTVRISLPNRMVLTDIYLEDHQQDTLFYAQKVTLSLRNFSRKKGKLQLQRAAVNKGRFRIYIDSTNTANIKYLVRNLRKNADTVQGKFQVGINRIALSKTLVTVEKFEKKETPYGINFTDLRLQDIDIHANDFALVHDTVHMDINSLNFHTPEGFQIKDLHSGFRISKRCLLFDDTRILTGTSNIKAKNIHFSFEDFQGFKKGSFRDHVYMDIDLEYSNLSMSDLAYFVYPVEGFGLELALRGYLYGYLNYLKLKDLWLGYNDNTRLAGDLDLIGLPDIKETYIYFDINELRTSVHDLESVRLPSGAYIHFPETLAPLGAFSYQGTYTGYYDDFVAYGTLNSEMGIISTDISIKPDTAEYVRYQGEIIMKRFDLGSLLDNRELFGKLSMNASLVGLSSPAGNHLVNMDGAINSVGFNDYDYRNIYLAGDFSNKIFDGSFSINDPNLRMEFFGRIDFSDSIPLMNFNANVNHVNLYPLNISKTEEDYRASFFLKANFAGANLDELNGEIELVNSLFRKEDEQIQVYGIKLIADNTGDIQRLVLESDPVDVTIKGQYSYATLVPSFNHMVYTYLPALYTDSRSFSGKPEHGTNNFSFKIDLKNTQPITSFFIPVLEIEDSAKIYGAYNPNDTLFDFTATFSGLTYKNNHWERFYFNAQRTDSAYSVISGSEKMTFANNLSLENLTMESSVLEDSIHLMLRWNNWDSVLYKGEIQSSLEWSRQEQQKQPSVLITLFPSEAIVSNVLWELDSGKIAIDSSRIHFDGLKFHNKNQLFALNGIISEDSTEQLVLRMNNMELSHVNFLMAEKHFIFDGIISGQASLADFYGTPLFLSETGIKGLEINDEPIGDANITARWLNKRRAIDIDVRTTRGRVETLALNGIFDPFNKDIDLDLAIRSLRLPMFNPVLDRVLTDIKGLMNAGLSISGTASKPLVNGSVEFQKTSFLVDYLQTRYSFSNPINVVNNKLEFSDFLVYDDRANQAILNGVVKNTYLKNFLFDLHLNADQFHFLETRPPDNEDYYGTAFASGIIRLSGNPANINLNISARTNRNTLFFIPIGAGSEVSEYDFVKFISPDGEIPETQARTRSANVKRLNLNFDLEVTQDAEIQLIFDPKMGDIMKARGNGNINMQVQRDEPFRMFGEYTIRNGEYLFTLQNVINKKLKVQPGGTINFNGEPTDALIDIVAIYSTKAPLTNLIPDAPEPLRKRIPVECQMIMTEKLVNPIIKLDIDLPTAGPEARNLVKNAIATEEELTKQFISLLVLQNFYTNPNLYGGAVPGNGASSSASVAGVTTSELLSNQLSNWLSQISNEFDVGVSYRPGTEISSDEVEVALSTQLLNDRISISGNVGVGGNQVTTTTSAAHTPGTTNIVGDFDVDFKLTDDGKLSLKAFNRSNDKFMYETSPYTQGVGVVYREEFNSVGELFNRYWNSIFRGKRD